MLDSLMGLFSAMLSLLSSRRDNDGDQLCIDISAYL